MAEQTVKLKLDTSQFDRGMQRVQGGFGDLTKVIAAAGAAFGGFQLGKTFLNTARSIENLKFQLAALTGSTQEAAKAMDILVDFAGGVPFQLAEIQQAAPSLLAVAKNTEELNELLAITGDIAAASGIDFATTALQLQRTFSAGIGAADLFRDRAVKSMLGFQEGVQYSAEQSRDLIINGFRDGTIAIAGSSAKMATTFDGVISMISDKFMKFQMAVMDSAPFDNLKAAATLVEQALESNFGSIEEAGRKIGVSIVDATKAILIGSAKILDALRPVFEFFKEGVNGIIRFANQLPPEAQILGLIGFVLVGRGVKLVLLAVAALFDEIRGFMDKMVKKFADAVNDLIDIANKIPGVEIDPFVVGDKEFSSYVDDINKKFVDFIGNATGDIKEIAFEITGLDPDTMGQNEKAIRKIIAALEEQIKKTKELEKAQANQTTKNITTAPVVDKKAEEKLKKQQEALKKQFESLDQSLMTETERENFEYNKKLDILNEYYKGRTGFDQEYFKLRERLEVGHQKKLADIAKAQTREQLEIFKRGEFAQLDFSKLSAEQKKEFAIGAGREVLDALAQQNKTAFQAAKALAITEAIINTAQGATKALAQGGVFGPILAGLVIAAGAAQIATIRSQKYQGRKTGGLVQKGQGYTVGESGPELFIPNQTGTIVPNRNMETPKNIAVTFNINALDARGVDELIVERKGIITNIIREAANQKGERSPV